MPTMPATFSVPARRCRSWPPPDSWETKGVPRRRKRTPVPLGPPNLWPERLRRSTPRASTSRGSAPAAWTASVWKGMRLRRSRARSPTRCAISAIGLDRADLVVGEHDGDEDGAVGDRARDVVGVDAAVAVDGHVGDVEAELLEVVAGVEDGVVLDRGGDDVVAGARLLLGEGDAFEGRVDRLGAAAGEDDVGGAAVRAPPRPPCGRRRSPSAPGAQGRRSRTGCRSAPQVGQHRFEGFGVQRCGGGVIEVDRVRHGRHSRHKVRRRWALSILHRTRKTTGDAS